MPGDFRMDKAHHDWNELLFPLPWRGGVTQYIFMCVWLSRASLGFGNVLYPRIISEIRENPDVVIMTSDPNVLEDCLRMSWSKPYWNGKNTVLGHNNDQQKARFCIWFSSTTPGTGCWGLWGVPRGTVTLHECSVRCFGDFDVSWILLMCFNSQWRRQISQRHCRWAQRGVPGYRQRVSASHFRARLASSWLAVG